MSNLPVLYCEDIKYPAYNDRLLMKSMGVQAGVVESEDFKVSAGTGLQVNVKKGKAFVEQTKAIEESSNTFYNGLYNVLNPIEQNPYNNVEVSAVNPQIAQIILRVYDVGELKIGGESYARIEWLNGTPNALATEAKMKEGVYEGRAELPQSSLRLANVLVPKNVTKSSEYYIEDARFFNFIHMPFRNNGGSGPVYSGENLIAEGEGTTISLPASPSKAILGVWSNRNNVKVKASEGRTINGDFIVEQQEITLNKGQHVILQGRESAWLIISGEPARKQVPGGVVSRSFSTEYIANSTRPTWVNLILQPAAEVGGQVILFINGEEIVPLKVANGTNSMTIYGFELPAGISWTAQKFSGTPVISSTYQTR